MKKLFLSLTVIGLVSFTSCGKTKESVEATEAETVESVEGANTLSIDGEVSVVNWAGYKIYEGETKEEGHNGFIKVTSGEVSTKEGKLVGGTFNIDVTTLESVDLNESPEDKAKLDGHLKSADFLDAEKFPTASFEITEVKEVAEGDFNSEISGNLKLRENPKNITFKANVEMGEGMVAIKSEDFVINRQDFGVEYSMKGGLLKDNVGIQIDVTATTAAAAQPTEDAAMAEEAPATEEAVTEEAEMPAE